MINFYRESLILLFTGSELRNVTVYQLDTTKRPKFSILANNNYCKMTDFVNIWLSFQQINGRFDNEYQEIHEEPFTKQIIYSYT